MADEFNHSVPPDELITAALNEAQLRSGMNKTGFVFHIVHGTGASESAATNWLNGRSEPQGGSLCKLILLLGPEFGTRLLAPDLRVVRADDPIAEADEDIAELATAILMRVKGKPNLKRVS